MKIDVHPKYTDIKIICDCGNNFITKSTLCRELHVEVCSACHPFYTGQQKTANKTGRVGKFQARYKRK